MKSGGFAFALTALLLWLAPRANARAPKASDYPPPKPVFPRLTGAPARAKLFVVMVESIVQRLSSPWSLAFLPDGKMLITELGGFLRTATKDGVYSAPIEGVPGVKVVAAQGLHDVALDPHFVSNRLTYLSYFASPPDEDRAVWPNVFFYGNITDKPLAERRTENIGVERVARARLSEDDKRLEDFQVLLEGVERRIAFASDGRLFITGADGFRFYDSGVGGPNSQFSDPDILRNFTGRVARIKTDGSILQDNPLMSVATVLPETFSYGHRDPEGIAINPATGELWLDEHGPLRGDEINIIRAGKNYDWPNVSYGRQYSGAPVAKGPSAEEGTEQPAYYWYPDIGPSGIMFYTEDLFPEWKGSLFVGALYGKFLVRLVLDGNRSLPRSTHSSIAASAFGTSARGPRVPCICSPTMEWFSD
jgi:aldose sugar dehydrogenase